MTTLNLASQRDLIKALLQFRPNQFRSRRGGGGVCHLYYLRYTSMTSRNIYHKYTRVKSTFQLL